jgi:Protein NO VEIN, C-terminal/EVE domain
VHLVDERGHAVDAEYHVETDGGHLALIMESRSGMSGRRAPRNPDYNRALAILLARLGRLNAVLVDALVDSRHTQDLGVPEADRRLIQAPIRLALEPDADVLRRRLGTAQAKIAQAPDATKGGNSTKRIRIRVDVPGYRLGDSARLARAVAVPVAQGAEQGPGYWWEREIGENVWMEITRRDDIGTDLKAPSAARGGVATASHDLVRLVQPGDVVVHYDSHREAIVGISAAASTAEPAPIYWVARGSYARRAGEQPRWLPGLRVALDRYRQLEPPVTLADIRQRKDVLLALRQRIQARADGQPIYFPWIPYQDTLRTFQSYLVKMPQEAISLFSQLRAMVDQEEAQPPGFVPASPAEQAEEAVKDAAGKLARPGRGQGFHLDQEAKIAVEALAMNVATEFYSKAWDVEDVHGSKSYDLICRRGHEEKHVEVKGTTKDGAEVILTPNEVRHAQENPCTALFVVSNITVKRAEDGTVTATGGEHHCYDPWRLDDGILIPLGFRYQIPASQLRAPQSPGRH